jgi:hypothetical protein
VLGGSPVEGFEHYTTAARLRKTAGDRVGLAESLSNAAAALAATGAWRGASDKVGGLPRSLKPDQTRLDL